MTPPPPVESIADLTAAPALTRRVRLTALIEIGLFLVPALAIDTIWGQADRFASIEPHPFWIIVLLLAVQYGTAEGLLATGACTVALLAGHMPVQSFDQNIHQYALQVLARPLLWMVASVILGELRGRHALKQMDTTQRLRDAERKVALLSQSHAEMSTIRARLEARLAAQLRTAAGVLEAGRKVDVLDPEQVLAGATTLLRTALNVKACSLFLLSGDSLTLAAAEGWTGERSFADRHSHTSALFQEVVGAQRYVSVASPDGQRALHAEGLMAGPLIDPETGTLFGMLKVEDMSFLDFNLSSLQTFQAVAAWIAATYGKALAHKRSQIHDDTTLLHSMTHLDQEIAYVTQMARRFRFDLALLQIQIQPGEVSESDRRALPAQLGGVAQRVLRGTDLLFSHQPPGRQFVVLLPGATPDGAAVVGRKLLSALREECGFDVPCVTQVRALCTVDDADRAHRDREAVPGAGQVA